MQTEIGRSTPWPFSLMILLCLPWFGLPNKLMHRSSLLAFTLLSAGMVISVATILNYGLGAAISVIIGGPLLVRVYSSTFGPIVSKGSGGLVLPVSLGCALQAFGPLDASLDITGAPARSVFWLVVYPLWYQSVSSLL